MGNTENIGVVAKTQSTHAVLVQSHSLAVLAQPTVDFAGHENLTPLQDKINKGIGECKDSARRYLDVVLPKAIDTVSNIDAYFATQNALADVLVPGVGKQTAISLLKAVQEQAQTYQHEAHLVLVDLQDLRTAFGRNSADCTGFAREINVVVKGDQGVLASIEEQLESIDRKVGGLIAGIVLGGLAVAGGIVMIGVGALTTVVTGGAAIALVAGGIATCALGVGTVVGTSLGVAKLQDEKAELIRRHARYSAEEAFATAVAKGIGGLANSALAASDASQSMANAWSQLDNDLGDMVTQLKKGQVESDALRALFATAARNTGETVRGDVALIRGQLAGARTTVDVTKTPGELIRAAVAA